jgi:transposase, IS5 family
MQRNMAKPLKNRASKQSYTSPKQLQLPGFETPFAQHLIADNRWVVLAGKIPWDTLVGVYQMQMHNSQTGADGINPRVAIGSIIIKHMCGFSDREAILQIQENMYMQYFLGYSSFSNEAPFDHSLFVELRKRLGADTVNMINEKILGLSEGGPIGREPPAEDPEAKKELKQKSGQPSAGPTKAAGTPGHPSPNHPSAPQDEATVDTAVALRDVPAMPADMLAGQREAPPPADNKANESGNDGACKGRLIVDATACPQDIRYPTDLDLLNDAREKSEELIDLLFAPPMHKPKPRTYREIARTKYLETAQKKNKTKKEIRNSVKRQLQYLRRNIKNIHKLLGEHKKIPFDRHQYKYLLVIQTFYDQQAKMYAEKTHSIEHRIVSIHQPHVRPIVRGKTNAKVEFGAKIQVSLMNGFAFVEDFSWEAFNEGTRLMDTVERYKKRHGHYPKEVLADQIYCTRKNRGKLKLLGIALRAKPLGRPKAVEDHVRPGERNPIESTFGQAKAGYGMNRIKARLSETSESWVASIILVLNLVKLAGQVPFYLIVKIISYLRCPVAFQI